MGVCEVESPINVFVCMPSRRSCGNRKPGKAFQMTTQQISADHNLCSASSRKSNDFSQNPKLQLSEPLQVFGAFGIQSHNPEPWSSSE